MTGGKDENIIIFKKENKEPGYIPVKTIEGKKVFSGLSQSPKVRSVCLSSDKKKLLVGTMGSEIFELELEMVGGPKDALNSGTLVKANQLMAGHYAANFKWTNEVWGLSIIDSDHFLTCSEDGTLRKWSISKKQQVSVLKLSIGPSGDALPPDEKTGDLQESCKLRVVGAYSSKDKPVMAAVGCKDGSLRVTHEISCFLCPLLGFFTVACFFVFKGSLEKQIIDLEEFKQVKMIRNSKKQISEVKFSPNGEHLAVGSHDNCVYVYSVKEKDIQMKFNPKKHSSYITHIDWAENSMNAQSTCGAYELLFWSLTTGTQLPDGATKLRDINWSTWTCTLGWPVQGIYLPNSDGTDINAVDRTKNETKSGYHELAVGDDFSKVRIFRYPCLKKGAEHLIGSGHSSHVTNVRWAKNDEYLISTGGEDQCIFQWKVTR